MEIPQNTEEKLTIINTTEQGGQPDEEREVAYERVFEQAFFEHGTIVAEHEEYDHYISLYSELKESLSDTKIIPIHIEVGKGAVPKETISTNNKNRWTHAENQQLIELKNEDPKCTWEEVADSMQKTARECCQQWHRVCLDTKKGRWTKQEDTILMREWSEGGIEVSGRSNSQIKMRAKRLGLIE